MRKFTHFLAIAWVLILLGTGCAPIYIPPAAQTPQFQQRGDFRGAAAVGINGLDIQAAYAPANGLGVLGSFSYQGNDDNNSHKYGELGAGWFLPSSNVFVLAAYGGVGIGSAHGESRWYINGNQYEAVADGRYLRPFLQGNLGIHSDVVDVGLVLRFAHVAMTYKDNNTTPQLPETANHMFFEPVAYLGVGFDPLKFFMQAGFSAPLDNQLDFAYQPLIYSIGLSVDLNLLGTDSDN